MCQRGYLFGKVSKACSKCSVPMKMEFEARANFSAKSTTSLAMGENRTAELFAILL